MNGKKYLKIFVLFILTVFRNAKHDSHICRVLTRENKALSLLLTPPKKKQRRGRQGTKNSHTNYYFS